MTEPQPGQASSPAAAGEELPGADGELLADAVPPASAVPRAVAAPRVADQADEEGTTTVHLVRHGEVFNPEKILYGRLPNYRLSEAGERQAKVTAEFLASLDVAAVVASPLLRAQQTAAPIAAAHRLSVVADHRLIESRNFFEGRAFEASPRLLRDPKMWSVMRNPLRPSWGEPYTEIAERMLRAAGEWRDAFPGRHVVLVSHQLPVWTARRALEGLRLFHRPDRRQCALASVTSAVYGGDGTLLRVDYAEPNGPTATGSGSVGA